ncbi:MAG: ASCH domain-containing protein [Ignavibacteriaceae bacterium]|nr:ASCH domain-containing protein [Ignavibacteriaceae bacterium]
MNNDLILLSIKPIYANKIFNGEKTIELRKKLPKNLRKGNLVLVYVSSPKKHLYGAFTVKNIIESDPDHLWRKVYKKACIDKKVFDKYYESIDVGYGIVIDRYWKLSSPISLKEIKNHDETFNIPQSFRYIKETDFDHIQLEFGVKLIAI